MWVKLVFTPAPKELAVEKILVSVKHLETIEVWIPWIWKKEPNSFSGFVMFFCTTSLFGNFSPGAVRPGPQLFRFRTGDFTDQMLLRYGGIAQLRKEYTIVIL